MLKRYEAIDRPIADQAILAWAFHDSIYKIQLALQQFVDNFPSRALRALLHVLVFPFGRRERMPGDRLTHKVAQLLLAPSDTRDRLTHGIYKSARTGHPIGLMEEALPQVIAAEPLERKLLKALKAGSIEGITWEQQLESAVSRGVLSAAEADIMVRVRTLVTEVIAVDEFRSEEIRLGQQRDSRLNQQHAA
jgi:acyl-CoA dehydrogenase